MLTIRQSALEIKNLHSIDKINFLPVANVISNLALLVLKTLSCTRLGDRLNHSFQVLQSKSFKDIIISALPIIGNIYNFYKIIGKCDKPSAAEASLAPERVQLKPVLQELPALIEGDETLETPKTPLGESAQQAALKQKALEKIQAFTLKHLTAVKTQEKQKKSRNECSEIACRFFAAGAVALISLQALNYYYLKHNS